MKTHAHHWFQQPNKAGAPLAAWKPCKELPYKAFPDSYRVEVGSAG